MMAGSEVIDVIINVMFIRGLLFLSMPNNKHSPSVFPRQKKKKSTNPINSKHLSTFIIPSSRSNK